MELPPLEFSDNQSSVVRHARYSPTDRKLTITLVGGNTYSYTSVEPSVWLGLYRAPSRGRFFARVIKGKYASVAVGVTAPTPSAHIAAVRRTLQALRDIDNVRDMRDPRYDHLRGRSRYAVYLAELRMKGIMFAEHAAEERKRNNAAITRNLKKR